MITSGRKGQKRDGLRIAEKDGKSVITAPGETIEIDPSGAVQKQGGSRRYPE
jgi:hypothetical protein